MVQDSAGFQSQQFGEQVAQRRDRYAAQNIDTWSQAANVVPRFQQAQQMVDERQIRAAKVASDLANDQLHRQQGLEDLQWAQQLHQTDMIGLQKRGMAAAIALQEAQARKAIDDLGAGQSAKYWDLTDEEMDYMASELGIIGNLNGGRLEIGKATPEQSAAAKSRRESRQTREQQNRLEQIRVANQARLDDPSQISQREAAAELSRQSASSKKSSLLMDRLEALNGEIMMKEYRAKNEQDPGTKTMLEQELIGLRQRQKTMSDQLDAEITGSGTQTADDQATIEEELGRAGSVLERFMGGSK